MRETLYWQCFQPILPLVTASLYLPQEVETIRNSQEESIVGSKFRKILSQKIPSSIPDITFYRWFYRAGLNFRKREEYTPSELVPVVVSAFCWYLRKSKER